MTGINAQELTGSLKSIGTQKVPVILVQFKDVKFSVAKNDEDISKFYDLYCNGTKDGNLYKGAGSYGAVRDYFTEMSNGLFLPEFDIIGPVTVSEDLEFYGQNTSANRDLRITQMYTEAIKAASEQGIDWDKYDNNKDGTIDVGFFIYAGQGENNSGRSTDIWPKENYKGGTLGGHTFSSYACCNELQGTKADGIGAMCHELLHALGLPDTYDTSGSGFYGMDYYDIMDHGCYSNKGYCPIALNGMEKELLGWQNLIPLTPDNPQEVTLIPVGKGGLTYKITNPISKYEYYVVENRQPIGWDSYIGNGNKDSRPHGMLIIHVSYNATQWLHNIVNADKKQRMTIIPAAEELFPFFNIVTQADYQHYNDCMQSILFPGKQNITELEDGRDYVYTNVGDTPNRMGQKIAHIREFADGTIKFTYCINTEEEYEEDNSEEEIPEIR